jgi:hypothetical protein
MSTILNEINSVMNIVGNAAVKKPRVKQTNIGFFASQNFECSDVQRTFKK